MARGRVLQDWEVFQTQLRKARKARKWSTAKLADQIRELGFDGPTASRIRQLETIPERASRVKLHEVIACAAGLGVAPVYLISPTEDRGQVRFGGMDVPSNVYRDWAEGRVAIGGWPEDWFFYYCEIAPQSRRKLFQEWARKDHSPGDKQDARVFIARTRHADLARLIARAEAEREEQ
jgi:transcriptional regulator with XRE-family HTH domain